MEKNKDNIKSETEFLHNSLSFAAKEQYKMLRTNLNFVIPDEIEGVPVIGITSSIRGEGKSITAINLAFSLADDGKKVLLIDADLRLPSISKKLNFKSGAGLTDVLCNKDATSQVNILKIAQSENLFVLTSGKIPPNPSELLGSKKMGRFLSAMSEKFDIILVDLPPVNIVTDALAISNNLTGMILVVRNDYVEKRELSECVRQLKLSNIKVLGTVINCDNQGGSPYKRHSYGYNKKHRYKSKYYAGYYAQNK